MAVETALSNKVSMTGDAIRTGLTGSTLGDGTIASITGTVDYAFFEVFDSLETYQTRRRQLKLSKAGSVPALSITETTDGINWTAQDVATTDELAGKADKYTKVIQAPQSWAELWALGPGVYTWVQASPFSWEPTETPSGSIRAELTVHSTPDMFSTLTATLRYVDGAGSLQSFIGEAVTDAADGRWVSLATATPPKWYAAPLAAGWTGIDVNDGLKYGRDDGGKCWLRGGVSPAALSYGAVCCTLPAGYRPNIQQWVATVSSVGTPRTFRIDVNGVVSLIIGATILQNGEWILFETTNFPCAT